MGKGDKKTAKGKITIGSYGNTRPNKSKKRKMERKKQMENASKKK
jgi:30S ribosomal protein S31